MKIFVTLAVVLVAATLTFAIPTEQELRQQFEKMMLECKTSEKPTDADVRSYTNDKIPASAAGKCFVGCMFEKMGLIVGGSFSRANAEKMAQEDFGNNKGKVDAAKAVFAKCEAEINAGAGAKNDKCFVGPALLVCIAKYDKTS